MDLFCLFGLEIGRRIPEFLLLSFLVDQIRDGCLCITEALFDGVLIAQLLMYN